MTRPLVTIGISTYNRADGYLRDALASALAQDYPNLEIVVSDNASNDATPELVRSMADERVRFFRQETNLGANGNFNFCLQQARGEYFVLLHDDDRLRPEFVSTCMATLADGARPGIVRSGVAVIDGDGGVRSCHPNHARDDSGAQLFLSWFGGDAPFYFCSTLFHTERLRAVGGLHTPRNLFQDVVAIARLSGRWGHRNVAAPLAEFRRHDTNAAAGGPDAARAWTDDSLFLLGVLTEEFPDQAAELRRRGLPYLCRKCYRYVANVPSFPRRFAAYLELWRRFEWSYAPIRYLGRTGWIEIKRTLAELLGRRRGSRGAIL